MTLTVGTACSGIGGAEVALALAGVQHESAWAIEIAAHQAAVMRKRLGVRVLSDVYEARAGDLERVDVFMAGFPCQPFSVAGRRGGERDPRNLWPEIARIVAELEPPVCVFENVPALRNPHAPGDASDDDEAEVGIASEGALPGYLGTVLGDLADLGYHVAWDGRSAANAGAWHRRDRIWIVAWKAGSVPDFDPFRLETVVLDAHEIGRWDGVTWGAHDLFDRVPVMKWPRAGIVRGPVAFEVGSASDPSERSSMWPTSRAEDAEQTGAHRANADTLTSASRDAMWPTVRTSDTNGAGTHGDGGLDLRTSVHAAMWPTVRASEEKGTGPLGSSSHEHRLGRGYLDATVQEATQRSGLLNPRWVEGLMGYPPGWTDLGEQRVSLVDVSKAWGDARYIVGDLDGTNPKYARHWLWHDCLGPLALPLAPREKQTKDRLIALGNAWVPQAAAPILARVAAALEAR